MANSSPVLNHSCSGSDRESLELLGLGPALAQSLTLDRNSTHLEINSDDECDDRPAVEVGTNTEGQAAIAGKEPTRKIPQSMLLRNLYVANLPSHVTARKLEELFADFGKIVDVRLLLDIATGSSRGIGFVMFEEPTAARDAIAKMHRYSIDGRLIQVRFAERGADEKREKIVGHVVYARNVPATTSTEAIREFFGQFGEVVEIEYHPQSHERGGPSPFNMTFIRFRDEKSAEAAVSMVDGQAPFPLPFASHPLIVAKVIRDVTCEMRKSIILRPRAPSGADHSFAQPAGSGQSPPPLPSFPVHQLQQHPTSSPGSSRTAATSDGEASISFSRDALPSVLQSSLSPAGTSNLDSFGYATTMNTTSYSPVPQLLVRGANTPLADSLSGSSSRMPGSGWACGPSPSTVRLQAMPTPSSPPVQSAQAVGANYTYVGQPPLPPSQSAFRLQPQLASGISNPQLMGGHGAASAMQSPMESGAVGPTYIGVSGAFGMSSPQQHQANAVLVQSSLQAQIQQQVELQVQQHVQQQLQLYLQQQVQQQVQQRVMQQVQQQVWLQTQPQQPPAGSSLLQLVPASQGYPLAHSHTTASWSQPPNQWAPPSLPVAPQPIIPTPMQPNILSASKPTWKRPS